MKLFECSSGGLINPANVTHCSVYWRGRVYVVKFNFTGGVDKELLFDSEEGARNEIRRYVEFNGQQTITKKEI